MSCHVLHHRFGGIRTNQRTVAYINQSACKWKDDYPILFVDVINLPLFYVVILQSSVNWRSSTESICYSCWSLPSVCMAINDPLLIIGRRYWRSSVLCKTCCFIILEWWLVETWKWISKLDIQSLKVERRSCCCIPIWFACL